MSAALDAVGEAAKQCSGGWAGTTRPPLAHRVLDAGAGGLAGQEDGDRVEHVHTVASGRDARK
jgi:hypothetical protein